MGVHVLHFPLHRNRYLRNFVILTSLLDCRFGTHVQIIDPALARCQLAHHLARHPCIQL
jgi:hypothetical protein